MGTVITFGQFQGKIVEKMPTQQLLAMRSGLVGSKHEGGIVHKAIAAEIQKRDASELVAAAEQLGLREQVVFALLPTIASIAFKAATEESPFEWEDVIDEAFDVADVFLEFVEGKVERGDPDAADRTDVR